MEVPDQSIVTQLQVLSYSEDTCQVMPVEFVDFLSGESSQLEHIKRKPFVPEDVLIGRQMKTTVIAD